MIPRKLKEIADVSLSYEYKSEDVILSNLESLGLQEITIYPPPLFIMSPRIKVYKASDIRKFKGYISKFTTDAVVEGEEPTATMTITPIEEK